MNHGHSCLVPVAFKAAHFTRDKDGAPSEVTPPLSAPLTMQGMQVRRLTPIETARLQGVPDDHCRIPYRGKPMADGPIYKMHGNGFCVPVVRWIGGRIDEVLRRSENGQHTGA